MTKIIWTNCAEQMPPPTSKIIYYSLAGEYVISYAITYIFTLLLFYKLFGDSINEAQWTIYTSEKWEELNNERDK